MPSLSEVLWGTLGVTSGAAVGVAVASAFDGNEGAIMPGLGSGTVKIQNYVWLAAVFATVGAQQGVRFARSQFNKLTALAIAVATYGGLSVADAAATTVTSALGLDPSLAGPLTAAAIITFSDITAAGLVSSPKEATSSVNSSGTSSATGPATPPRRATRKAPGGVYAALDNSPAVAAAEEGSSRLSPTHARAATAAPFGTINGAVGAGTGASIGANAAGSPARHRHSAGAGRAAPHPGRSGSVAPSN